MRAAGRKSSGTNAKQSAEAAREPVRTCQSAKQDSTIVSAASTRQALRDSPTEFA